MKHFRFILAAVLAVSLALPIRAQDAPAGWSIQKRANGATTFTPSDLRAGEKYNVTVYPASSTKGKSLEAYLREFAGTVGTNVGQLIEPLKINASNAQVVTGIGTYVGPNGAALNAMFIGASFDGANISIARTLFSKIELISRYRSANDTLLSAMAQRARDHAGDKLVSIPDAVSKRLKPGGALVPGVYAGKQFHDEKLKYQLRLYIYPSGGYRFKNERDENMWSYGAFSGKSEAGVGTASYNPVSGQLDLGSDFHMSVGTGSDANRDYCFYGRSGAGQPAIYAQHDLGFHTARTHLVRVGPIPMVSKPTDAQTRQIVARNQKAADDAVRDGFKWVTAPGKGVSNAQIQAIVQNYSWTVDGVTDDAYLLLKDGTIHNGLSVAPDQLDVAASRRNEPKAWGKWRKNGSGYQVSWAGQKWEKLPGQTVIPGAAGMRLEGRYATVRATMYSHQFWGVTFDKKGRFSKDQRGGATTGNIPIEGGLTPRVDTVWNGGMGDDRAGTYSIQNYTLTLRYDNGAVVRLPFFFRDSKRKQLWFEGDTLELGLED